MVIESWVAWTLLAAGMQSVRTAAQKHLTSDLSASTATMVRYLFGLPFAIVYLLVILGDQTVPQTGMPFFVYGFGAGVLQIVATILLLKLMTLRNFAVGSTYTRTEVMLTAVIGMLFFTETVTFWGWVAILVCVVGLVIINVGKSGGLSTWWNQSAVFGLGAGLSFALCSLFLRAASLSLGLESSVLAAAMTLVYMVSIQTLMTLAWVLISAPDQLRRVAIRWRPCLFVGVTSVAGSAGWFTAMTLELASYVKTLGQIEFLFTFLIGWYFFRERPTRAELVGMALIMVSVLVLLLTQA